MILPEEDHIISFLSIEPWPFVIQVVFIGHADRVITHRTVADIMCAIPIPQGLMEPPVPVISIHVANYAAFFAMLFDAHQFVGYKVKGLIP